MSSNFPRIVVVDDDADVRAFMVDVLSLDAYQRLPDRMPC